MSAMMVWRAVILFHWSPLVHLLHLHPPPSTPSPSPTPPSCHSIQKNTCRHAKSKSGVMLAVFTRKAFSRSVFHSFFYWLMTRLSSDVHSSRLYRIRKEQTLEHRCDGCNCCAKIGWQKYQLQKKKKKLLNYINSHRGNMWGTSSSPTDKRQKWTKMSGSACVVLYGHILFKQ